MTSSIDRVRSFIDMCRRRRVAWVVARRCVMILMAFMGVSAALHLLFMVIPWTLLPLIFDLTLLFALIGVLAVFIDALLIRRTTGIDVARRLERTGGDAVSHPLLSIALELSQQGNRTALHDEVFNMAAAQIPVYRSLSAGKRPVWFIPAVLSGVLLYAGLTILVTMFARPSLFSYWWMPLLRQEAPLVYPGTVRLARYASVGLELQPRGRPAPSCLVEITDLKRQKRSVRRVRPDEKGKFTIRLDSLVHSFVYSFTYGGLRCPAETVTVVEPPQLEGLELELSPPKYTSLPAVRLPEGQGDFSAYGGTRVSLTIESSHLRSAELLYNDDTIPLHVTGTTASGGFTVNSAGSYGFLLTDSLLQRNDSLTRFSAGLLPDDPPTVRFIRPGINKNLEPAQIESLIVEASDDLGVRRAELFWRKGNEANGSPERMDLSPPRPGRTWVKSFLWHVSRLSLYPGDTLFYWARVSDTRSVGTPQYATSDTFWLRIPTFDEIHRTMAQRDLYARESMSAARLRQRELEKAVQRLDRDIGASDDSVVSWESRQLARGIEAAIKTQADSLNAALRELGKNIEELRREGGPGEEIARKMEEVQKALRELVGMYGDDSLFFPKDSSVELSMEEMREAVEKLNDMLPELGERLDNALQFLEALKRDRELGELAARAEKLAEEQAMLADDDKHDGSVAARQEELVNRIEKLQKDIRSQSDPAETDDVMQRIDSLGASMQRELSMNRTPPSDAMRRMSANLASLSQNLREKTASYMEKQLEELRRRLFDLAGGSIGLTSWQERIHSGEYDGDKGRQLQAREQQALIEALMAFEHEFDSLTILPPPLRGKLRANAASAREAARAAVESLGENSGGRFAFRASEQALRVLAAGLLETLSMMDSRQDGGCSSGAAGIRESLRRMSGRQAAINSATAQLLRSMMQGGKQGGACDAGSGSGSESARREAQAAQQALADDLKALAEKFGDASGEGMKKRVEELEKEARALSKMLNVPREEVADRQDRFLARMLQSTLSLHREEEGKEERKSTSAGIVFTPTPSSSPDSTVFGDDAFHKLRRNALEYGNFPASYRTSINAYFDSLGILFLKQTR